MVTFPLLSGHICRFVQSKREKLRDVAHRLRDLQTNMNPSQFLSPLIQDESDSNLIVSGFFFFFLLQTLFENFIDMESELEIDDHWF